MRLAYGYNRKEKDFAKLSITAGKFFIDNKFSGLQERLDMMQTLREGATVVLLSMADLGKGKAQLKAVAAIEATGAIIEVQSNSINAPAEMGRPKTVVFDSDEDLKSALEIWAVLPEKEALIQIGRQFDKFPNRNRMNYLVRKDAKSTNEK